MNVFSKMKSGALATVLLVSFAVIAPQAQAHNCKGKGTITIREVAKNDFWYFQGGRVCGRFVA